MACQFKKKVINYVFFLNFTTKSAKTYFIFRRDFNKDKQKSLSKIGENVEIQFFLDSIRKNYTVTKM